MSLLWPDRILVGLFPGSCWLRRGSAVVAAHDVAISTDAPAELLRAMDHMLEGQSKTLMKRTRVDVIVSDIVGHTIVLPWQERLTSSQQHLSYAKACFSSRGEALDDGWIVQAGFRYYGGAGIGLAFPEALVISLRDQLAGHGLRLRSVLPASAAAYWNRRKGGRGCDLLLLNEGARLTALAYETNQLCELDVQAVLDSRNDAGVRLLRRVSARFADVKNVGIWSAAAEKLDESIVKNCLPSALVQELDQYRWSRQ